MKFVVSLPLVGNLQQNEEARTRAQSQLSKAIWERCIRMDIEIPHSCDKHSSDRPSKVGCWNLQNDFVRYICVPGDPERDNCAVLTIAAQTANRVWLLVRGLVKIQCAVA